eukprot:s15_g6.t1
MEPVASPWASATSYAMAELKAALPQMLKALRSAKQREEEFFQRQQAQANAEEALREECRRERRLAAELWSRVQQLQDQIQAGDPRSMRSPQGRS